jgi:hypothetical protein
VIEFVEECRREWKRLGVPDPIANEMAVDLTADIEEAEAEGGSAEDVLGNSLFDPRRFAAAWASARGVVGSPASTDSLAPIPHDRHSLWRQVTAIALAVVGVLVILAAATVVVGRHGVAVAASVSRIVVSPGPVRVRRSIGFGAPFHYFVPGPFSPRNGASFVAFALVALLVVVVVALGLALLYRPSWMRRDVKRRFW